MATRVRYLKGQSKELAAVVEIKQKKLRWRVNDSSICCDLSHVPRRERNGDLEGLTLSCFLFTKDRFC